jgi:LmbE family N-acetylglucosaminyl deacetylase
MLPGWWSALVVVAHPDDETFGLGALIAGLTTRGTAVQVLCFTRGEASTLNENDSDLLAARARELRQAGSALGVACRHPAGLSRWPPGQHPAGRAGGRCHPAGRPSPARWPAGLR